MGLSAAFVALNRFGLGARPGEAALVQNDPRAWLTAQLSLPTAPQITGIADTAQRFHVLDVYRHAKADADRTAAAAEKSATDKSAATLPGPPFAASPAPAAPKPAAQAPATGPLAWPPGRIVDTDLARRLDHMAASDSPVLERLSAFWSNHFAVAAIRDDIGVLVVPYENEAIRPHVQGHFRDMLEAAATHPAMALYLDQAASFGPASAMGQRRHKAANENFAREVMELHTLGVKGGYTQADVEQLALALTGLGVDTQDGEPAFFPARHEPGMRKLLGKTLPDGATQPQAAFDLLARHPATARHVCAKLATHFCGDAPPKALTARLVHAWQSSGGNLPALYQALAASPEAWAPRPLKYRSPQDFVLAAARALELRGHGPQLLAELRAMGQFPFRAPAPTGWPDGDADWITPAGIMARVGAARRLAGLAHPPPDALSLLSQSVPLANDSASLDVLAGEPDPGRAVILALAAAEFQQR